LENTTNSAFSQSDKYGEPPPPAPLGPFVGLRFTADIAEPVMTGCLEKFIKKTERCSVNITSEKGMQC
jgi:hypothetical protein